MQIKLQGGTFLSLSPGLIYDTRNSTINPRSGLLANVRFDEALNVGGFENSYGKLTGSVKKYVPIGKNHLCSLARAGGT